MNKLIALYRKLHSTDLLTWVGHAIQAFLIVGLTYAFMVVMPGEWPHDARLGVGTYGALMVFGHRELSDIIPAWIKAHESADPDAQKHLTAKLKDGFGDFWSVPVGVALFALVAGLF